MKKRAVWCSVLLAVILLFIAGCEEGYDGDLPPEPAAPYSEPTGVPSGDLAGQASYPFEVGFSSPNDVYEEDAAKAQLFFVDKPQVDLLTFETDTFEFPVRVTHPGGVVYKYGYVYTKNGWVRYEFPQATFRNSAWIVQQASANLQLNRADFVDEANWIVAYSCKKHAGKWRCGMQEKDVVCDPVNKAGCWMLQDFKLLNLGLPTEPAALENLCTDTDGGRNLAAYGTKGTTTGIYVTATERTSGSVSDECVNANTLKEWYCTASQTNPVRDSEEVVCNKVLPGTTCVSGACKPAGTVATATLTVTRAGNGAGTVSSTSNPTQADQITNCDGTAATDCSAVYPAQTLVTLTVAPTSGATVTWSESACTGNTCVVTTGTTEKTVTVTFTAAAPTPAATFAVCRVPLKKFGGERTVWTQPIGTTLTPQAACAQYKVFGTAAKEPFAVAEADLSEARIVTTTDSLECKVPCAAGREAIQTCKYLGMVPEPTPTEPNNPADANAQFILDPLSKCS